MAAVSHDVGMLLSDLNAMRNPPVSVDS